MIHRGLASTACLGFLALAPCLAQSPKVNSLQDNFFLKRSFAIWPLPNANLDLDLRKTVAEKYPNRQAFLSAVDAQLQKACASYRGSAGPTPEEVRAFVATPEGEALKDLAALLTQAKTNPVELSALMERLAALPVLKDLSHLVVPYGLTGGRGIASAGGSSWVARAPTGPPGSMSGPQGQWLPTGSGAASTVYLRLFVVDLKGKQLLLEGRVGASASSSFMKVTALHELEERLGQNLVSALLNPS
jgi:hypothetical protein